MTILKTFAGIDESLKHKFTCVVLPTYDNISRIENEILTPIQSLSDRYNSQIQKAQTNFPMHVTLIVGDVATSQSDTSEYIDTLIDNQEISKIIEKLYDQELIFDTLELTGESIILKASTIPQPISLARNQFEAFFTTHHIAKKPIDILHSTLVRFIQLPPTQLEAFTHEIETTVQQLSTHLKTHPINQKIVDFYKGSTWNLLNFEL